LIFSVMLPAQRVFMQGLQIQVPSPRTLSAHHVARLLRPLRLTRYSWDQKKPEGGFSKAAAGAAPGTAPGYAFSIRAASPAGRDARTVTRASLHTGQSSFGAQARPQ